MWVNLIVCDRLASDDLGAVQKDELVRRYQQIVRPYAGRLYIVLALVMALIAASGTIGEWQNWILFRHGGNFGVKDPQFHKDIGFYVFKLPFMNFVVDWTLAILIVTLIVSVVFHYLNGGILPQRGIPRVRPAVKAHLSVLAGADRPGQGGRVRPAALGTGQRARRLRRRRRLHRRARPPAGAVAARRRLDLRRRHPALQHPAPGMDAARPRRGHLGLRGARRRRDLPGAAADAQGHPGPGLARGALHPAEHHGHPRRLRPEPCEGQDVSPPRPPSRRRT